MARMDGTPSPSASGTDPALAALQAALSGQTSGVIPTSSTYGSVYGIGVTPAGQWYGSGGTGGSLETHPAFDNGLAYNQALSYIWSPTAAATDQKKYISYLQWFHPKGATASTQKALWSSIVGIAAKNNYSYPGQKMTPWDVLDQMKQQAIDSGYNPAKSGSSGGGSGSHGSVSTSTSYSFTGKQEAGAVLDNAWQQLLGQSATEQDKANFLSKLHAEQQAQPTSQTQRVSASGTSSSVSQHTTSVSPQADAIAMAQAQPEYNAFQDATTYFDAMMSALGAPK